ncbi:oxidoreductase [Escherichia coli]|uniref:Oxidoreductase n=1 Tax=Escherichia coli TaxID=562 RepID=A0A376MI94_ECOLX|nr:oxidoreductase [Escherichia coli]
MRNSPVSLVHEAHKALGGLDIMALVAGKQVAIPDIADLTSEQFQKTFAINVFALFWLTQEAIPLLPKGASIITTSSIQAYQPSPHLLDYAATKAAILNYSRGLAKPGRGERYSCEYCLHLARSGQHCKFPADRRRIRSRSLVRKRR